MGLKNFIKIGSISAVLFVLLITVGNCAFAQVTPGTENGAASIADTEALKSANAAVYKSAFFYTLLFLLTCIFVGVIGKVLKVYELTKNIQGKSGAINWNKIQAVLLALMLVIGMYGVYWSIQEWGWAGGIPASEHGERIDFMLYVTIVITGIVFVLTHILLFGFSYKYAGSNKRKAYFYPHNNAIERIWTIVPAVVLTILVLLGFFTWRSITNISEEDQKMALNIEVVGEQFKWNIRYAGNDNELGLKNYQLTTPTNSLGIDFKDRKSWDDKLGGEIVLPVNRAVRFNIGSKDILHSFYIPTMRVQMNAVPGMPTYFQFTPKFTTEEMREKSNDPTFDYILLCNKICGTGHYNMQTKVTVVTESEYQQWIAKQQLLYNDDIKKELQMTEAKEASSVNSKLANNK